MTTESFPMSFFDYKLFLLEINPKNRWFVEDVHFPKKHFAGSILIFQRAPYFQIRPTSSFSIRKLAFPDLNIGIFTLEKPDPPEAMNEKTAGEKQKSAGRWAALGPWWVFFFCRNLGWWYEGIRKENLGWWSAWIRNLNMEFCCSSDEGLSLN